MRLPKQAPPVQRGEVIAPQHQAVDASHGQTEDLIALRMELLHGANYNAPAAFCQRSYAQLKTSGGYLSGAGRGHDAGSDGDCRPG